MSYIFYSKYGVIVIIYVAYEIKTCSITLKNVNGLK